MTAKRLIDMTDADIRAIVREEIEQHAQPPDDSSWMTLGQAAKFLHLSTKTLVKRAKAGEVPYKMLGDVYRFSRRELEKALKAG